jgi:succinate dehydrogenase/fumarate reductase-like Fe-S protein
MIYGYDVVIVDGGIAGLVNTSTVTENLHVAACPGMLKEDPEFIRPVAVLRAQRHIFDSPAIDTEERMKILEKPPGIWSCKSYYKCTQVCPKRIRLRKLY